ncbi:MAG: hypothetical protein GY722_27775 [bacterium]|nr:hypothetical protein [bacterium]
MDSEKVRWFARVVLEAEIDPPHYLYKKLEDGWGHLDSLPRDLNAVAIPAAEWLRSQGYTLVLTFDVEAVAEVRNHKAQRAPHPAEAIIELCWEVGHA